MGRRVTIGIVFWFGSLILCFAEQGASPAPISKLSAVRTWIGDALLPHPHFWYETTPLPLSDAKLFGSTPFQGTSLGRASIPPWVLKSYRLTEETVNPLLRAAFPGLLSRLESPVETLYRVGERRELTPQELSQLEKYGERERFERYHAKNKGACSRLLGKLSSVLPWGFRGLAAVSTYHAAKLYLGSDRTPSLEQYLSDTKFRPKDDEVQLLVETVPFPHLAIRVRDKIYSYGVSHLSASTPEQYLGSQEFEPLRKWVEDVYSTEEEMSPEVRAQLNELFPREDWVREQGKTDDWRGKSIDSVFHKLKLDQLSRSVQVVTLRLGEEKVNVLKRKLEMNRGKAYDNRTLVNDCSTMVCREIGLWNPVVDPSPGTVITTLSMQEGINPNVRGVFQIETDRADSGKAHILRNAYINYLEGSLHYASLMLNLPERFYMEMTKEDKDLQYWTPPSEALFKQYQRDVARAMELERRVVLFRLRAEKLASEPTDNYRDRDSFLSVADHYFQEEIEKTFAIETSVDSEQKEVLYSRYRKELLESTQRELHRVLKKE